MNFNYRTKQLVKLLGGFEELRQATIGFITSVCHPVCPSAWNNSALTGRIFHEIWYLSAFRKFLEKNSIFINICQEYPAIYMETYVHSW